MVCTEGSEGAFLDAPKGKEYPQEAPGDYETKPSRTLIFPGMARIR